jgi:hypothetical protein
MGKLVSQEQLQQYVMAHGLTTAADAQQLVKELLADTLQAMLEAELTHTLGHPKGGHSQTGNRRNGHSAKTVRTEGGEVRAGLPRGVAFAMTLRTEIIAELPTGPTRAYFDEYERLNDALSDLSRHGADWLRAQGYRAEAQTSTTGGNDPCPCGSGKKYKQCCMRKTAA